MSTLNDICLRHNSVCQVTGKQLKMLSHETVNQKLDQTGSDGKDVKQSEMFNYFVCWVIILIIVQEWLIERLLHFRQLIGCDSYTPNGYIYSTSKFFFFLAKPRKMH